MLRLKRSNRVEYSRAEVRIGGIQGLLTRLAKRGPWQRRQTLRADRFSTVPAFAITAAGDSIQCVQDLTKEKAITLHKLRHTFHDLRLSFGGNFLQPEMVPDQFAPLGFEGMP